MSTLSNDKYDNASGNAVPWSSARFEPSELLGGPFNTATASLPGPREGLPLNQGLTCAAALIPIIVRTPQLSLLDGFLYSTCHTVATSVSILALPHENVIGRSIKPPNEELTET